MTIGESYTALIFSRTGTDSALLGLRARKQIKSLGIALDGDSVTDLRMAGYGRLRFLNSVPDSSRGADYVYDVFYDECFHLEQLKAIRDAASACQSIPSAMGDAKEFFVGTPNYTENYGYQLLSQGNEFDILDKFAEIDKGIESPAYFWEDSAGWLKCAIHFRAHPLFGRDPEAFLSNLRVIRKLDESTIKREYRLDHTSGMDSYFNEIDITACEIEGVLEDDRRSDGLYFVGIDPNAGSSDGDYFSVTVLRFDPDTHIFRKVAGYRRKGESSEYHLIFVKALIEKYRPVLTCVESNGVGKFIYESLTRQLPMHKLILVSVDSQSKKLLCSRVRWHLECRKLIINTGDSFVGDARAFRQDGESLGAISGKHDDDVMSLAHALAGAKHEAFI